MSHRLPFDAMHPCTVTLNMLRVAEVQSVGHLHVEAHIILVILSTLD